MKIVNESYELECTRMRELGGYHKENARVWFTPIQVNET